MSMDDDLWTSLPTPALLVASDDHIVDANPAAEGFLNTSRKSLRNASFWEKIRVDAPLEDAFARARRDHSVLYVNDIDVGAPGRAGVMCNIQIAPLTGSDGQMIFLISPRELVARLSRPKGAQSAAQSAIGMAEMLAHEIKNPLAGITGAAQLLSMNLSNGDLEMTDLIVAESRRIVKLLEQVEQFGNLRPPDKNRVNIHDVLDRARKSAMVGFGASMAFVEEYDPSLPPTLGDADQLLQVFLNLLKNASEAAGNNGGTIRLKTSYDLSLRLRRKDGTTVSAPLLVEIIDDGPGLPPAVENTLFEPFVSGRENGTGLGLALVSKIITEHDGWVAVDSVPGHTVFRISLPITTDETRRLNVETH
ncbi:two-component system sensor histidine kinase NtrB [Parasulfitobacter algicola]|uniref:histidine kinase n=1 Tax=Parasulfitobacter algicola TaxID=2614809 RepID=A0ABX2IQT1_9RHOB|nr:ATP-binding protein [Sulfitobacter algicola]NSX55234.1 PAS domain-containing sensor histidine kinase [Sulfitobacter algicola]